MYRTISTRMKIPYGLDRMFLATWTFQRDEWDTSMAAIQKQVCPSKFLYVNWLFFSSYLAHRLAISLAAFWNKTKE